MPAIKARTSTERSLEKLAKAHGQSLTVFLLNTVTERSVERLPQSLVEVQHWAIDVKVPWPPLDALSA